MGIFRATTLLTLLFVSGSCFAQANLVLKNGEGQTVGWLQSIDVRNDNNFYQYLTPTGLILTLDWKGAVVNSNSMAAEKLLYVLPDCQGEAWVAQSDERVGEVYPLNNDLWAAVFVGRDFALNPSFGIDPVSEKSSDGNCINAVSPRIGARRVSAINPTELGLTFFQSSGWLVSGGEHSLDRPNQISCNGFESCPQ